MYGYVLENETVWFDVDVKEQGGVCLWERGKQRDMHVYVCAHASRVIRSSCGLESVVR